MVANLVREVGGDQVEVTALMGPGVDPHLYKATASDVSKLRNAEVIFYSGLKLEGKMTDIFEKMARSKKPVHAVTDAVAREKLLEPPEFAGHYDPHVWFDIELWSQTLDAVVAGLSAARPEAKAVFAKRGAEARQRMLALHEWAKKRVAELPENRRILVTSHDAYSYFGRAYGFQVVGLQGVSTVTEAGLADMAKLVDFIRQRGVKSIFVESSVPPNTIQRIAKDAGVSIGGELYSDAMGAAGDVETVRGETYDKGTYEGMIKHNFNTIVESLK